MSFVGDSWLVVGAGMLKVGIFGLDSQLVNVVDGGGQNVSQLKIDDDFAVCFLFYAVIDADAD